MQKICPDPGLSINIGPDPNSGGQGYGGGQVNYKQTMSSVGCDLIAYLASSPVYIGIRGEAGAFSVNPTAGYTLLDVGGAAVFDQYPNTTTIDVIYDISDCNGHGQWVQDGGGNYIANPLHVVLFHELSHAKHFCQGNMNLADPETQAINDENAFRSTLQLPLRQGHIGGCNPPPQKNGSPPPPPPTCYIATAAYGTSEAPEIDFLSRLRDNVVFKLRTGEQLYNKYYEKYSLFSPYIVRLMENDPDIKELVKWLVVTPIVRYLKMLKEFPDSNIDLCDEPWKSFLMRLRDELEDWSKPLGIPYDFTNVSPVKAAEEIDIVLKYSLRREEARSAYLLRLEETKQIPLSSTEAERRQIAESLKISGRTEIDIKRILGFDEKEAEKRKGGGILFDRGSGSVTQEIIPSSQAQSSAWYFEVYIVNMSGETFDQIVLFYSTADISQGVVFLQETSVVPNQVVVFRLGVCSTMISYTVGFFQGDNLVAQIPDSDPVWGGAAVVTPALAMQVKQANTPCVDGWDIT